MSSPPPRHQAGGLLLCATSKDNLSSSYVLELLQRIGKVIKARGGASRLWFPDLGTMPPSVHTTPLSTPSQDYCGVLSEDSLRKNFVLVYELLDEMVDFG